MITVVANRFVKENTVAKAITLYKQLVKETLAEDGCLRYELHQDEKDSTHFVMIEEWSSKEALDNHFKSQHFTNIIPQLDLLTKNTGDVYILKKV